MKYQKNSSTFANHYEDENREMRIENEQGVNAGMCSGYMA